MLRLKMFFFFTNLENLNKLDAWLAKLMEQSGVSCCLDADLTVTPCYKQFLLGLELPEKSADAEKSEILRADFKYVNLKIELLQIF